MPQIIIKSEIEIFMCYINMIIRNITKYVKISSAIERKYKQYFVFQKYIENFFLHYILIT